MWSRGRPVLQPYFRYIKITKWKKKRCFSYVSQYNRITILKHKLNNYFFLEECKRTYAMIPAGLSKPSLQFLHQSIPGRQHTYLPQVVVQPNVVGMLAKAVFPALCSGTPTYPATERIEGGRLKQTIKRKNKM